MFCKAYNPGNVPCTRHGGFRGSNTCDDHYHYNKTMCTICKNPVLNPNLLTCGHLFCMTCVHKLSKNSSETHEAPKLRRSTRMKKPVERLSL